ncbi:MAG: hypothetical protein Q9178_005599 [Gyalolechia marmorata]
MATDTLLVDVSAKFPWWINGKGADSFLSWFDQPCEAGNYTDVVSKIFNPLCDVPDPAIANIDSKVPQKKDKRSPKGKGGGGGSKGGGDSKGSSGSSSGSKPADKPPPKKEEKTPQPPKKNDPPSAPAKKPDVTATKPDKKPTKATKPVTSLKSKVKPTSSSQTKSNKVSPSSLTVTSEPQDIAPAPSSAGEPDTVAVVATDEVEDSVFATPSASVPESVEAVATSGLLDVSPSASITDSASLSSEQPLDIDAQPLASIEDELAATSLGTVEEGSTATGDVSLAIAAPSLRPETNEESSLGLDEVTLPTTLKTSTIAQPTASDPPEATSECPAESTDVSEAEDGTTVIKKRNVIELTMRQTPQFGATYIGFVELNEMVRI